jgi:hypothetical protein
MQLPAEKVHTIHLGVKIDDYKYISTREKERNIGYISGCVMKMVLIL